MGASTERQLQCPVVTTLERVGDRWSILLLHELFRGAHRFDVLQAGLGIASNILSARLARLTDAGFIEKRAYQKHPPRFDYLLSERGEDFMPVLFAILEFDNRHFAPDGPAMVVVDTATMELAEPVVVDRKTDVRITSGRFIISSAERANARTLPKNPVQVCKTGTAKASKKRPVPKRASTKSST